MKALERGKSCPKSPKNHPKNTGVYQVISRQKGKFADPGKAPLKPAFFEDKFTSKDQEKL
jgi:hypothetical protein